MTFAKLFKHGGSQAVRLPKAFRFPGTEVIVERRGDEVVLKPKKRPPLKTWADVARHLSQFGTDFPNRAEQPPAQKRDITW